MRHPVLMACAIAALAATAHAAPRHGNTIEVRQPWSRPASALSTGAGFMTLINPGPRPVALLGAESPLAARVQIHRSAHDHGMASMAAEDRVDIPPGGSLVFAPGGYHLMFVQLSRGLNSGDRLPATLVFSDGRKVRVEFAVGSGLGPPSLAKP